MQDDLNRKVDLAFLAAFYGGLLTENQRRILSLHCEEDLSLGEIAEEVGYSSSGSLINLFVKKVGSSPGQYRKSHKSLKR